LAILEKGKSLPFCLTVVSPAAADPALVGKYCQQFGHHRWHLVIVIVRN